MQDTAIDPETGAIDMDIINTGISSSRRTLRSDLAKELRELLLRTLPALCVMHPATRWLADSRLASARPDTYGPQQHLSLQQLEV